MRLSKKLTLSAAAAILPLTISEANAAGGVNQCGFDLPLVIYQNRVETVVDCRKDADHDELPDQIEARVTHTDPMNSDTDGDGMKDGAEVRILGQRIYHNGLGMFDPNQTYRLGIQYASNPTVADRTMIGPNGVSVLWRDADGDCLSDLEDPNPGQQAIGVLSEGVISLLQNPSDPNDRQKLFESQNKVSACIRGLLEPEGDLDGDGVSGMQSCIASFGAQSEGVSIENPVVDVEKLNCIKSQWGL